VKTYAICLRCEGSRGRSLRSGWGGVLWFLFKPILLLCLALALLYWLFGK
jgi:hypothetical protein